MTTLRVLLHVAAQRDYELHFFDFSTAFLQSSLHEEIWLHRPPGFTGSFPPGTQWSLRRPVCGLRQAPREWHDTLRTALAALGFAPSTADPSLFLRTDTSLPFYVLWYVDDLVFATADTEALTLVKSELQKRHTCTDLGELRSYLGLQITEDRARRTITLTQSHMVHQVFQRFGFQFSSPQPTPLSTGHSLSAPPSDESVEPSAPPGTAKTAPVPSAPGSQATTPASPLASVPAAPMPTAPAAPLVAPAPAAPLAAPAPAAPPEAPAPAAPPAAPAPAAPSAAPAPAAPLVAPAPVAPPIAPAPAAPPAAPAPAAPPAAPAPAAPVARRQCRAYHSRSRCEERGSRRNGTPGEPPS
ncbi:unnamed protein product [Closterium sp. NIES-54]